MATNDKKWGREDFRKETNYLIGLTKRFSPNEQQSALLDLMKDIQWRLAELSVDVTIDAVIPEKE